MKILLVEDDQDLRENLMEVLQKEFDVVAAENGQLGYEKALELHPRLIITDINMPGVTGLEMVARLRKAEFYTPVVFISGFTDARNVREANRLGAFDFLEKPVRVTKIMATVRSALMIGGKFISSIAKVDDAGVQAASQASATITLSMPEVVVKQLKAYAQLRNLDPSQIVAELVMSKLK